MSSFVDLTRDIHKNHSATLVQALSTNISRGYFAAPIGSSSYTSNWSVSHTPGPPIPYFPLSLLSSATVKTTSTVADIIVTSSEDRYYPFWLLVVIAIFGSVTSVLTVLGNILVMLAFFLDRQIRQPTNYFILSLSVSDFLIGLLSMPLLTIYIYAKDWPLNAIICDIWLSLDYTVCLTSIYTVLFITIDRFCSVKMPAKYRKWRTGRKINIMIAMTWAVPTLIFFTSTMVYPRLKGLSNMQNGVCDVQWNKNHVFNLCLTIGYFWTTLFVMIVLYIFIYGVASNLERKSRENARKMSSLVGAAGHTMTHIGVGIGGNRSPAKLSMEKQNHRYKKVESTTGDDYDDEDPQNLLAQSVIQTQNSSNSSEQRRAASGGGVGDDENSNSCESHSDLDGNHSNEKQGRISSTSMDKTSRTKNRRGLSVNWGSSTPGNSNITSTILETSRQSRSHRNPTNQKHGSNVKFFATSMAQSLYRNPIRLSGLSSTTKPKINNLVQNKSSPSLTPNQTVSTGLAPIPSESELPLPRVLPPPQPRPECLAIMSDEVFHERLKARQCPLVSALSNPTPGTSLMVNTNLSAHFPSTSSFLLDKHCIEDVTYSTTNQNITTDVYQSPSTPPTPVLSLSGSAGVKDQTKQNTVTVEKADELLIDEKDQVEEEEEENQETFTVPIISSPIKLIKASAVESSDESWRLLNSNSSLDEQIPYIDETDFEDLGYILHRRRVPPINSNEPIHEETIVYRSPFYLKTKQRTKLSSVSSSNTSRDHGIDRKIYEIYGNHPDAHKAILESSIFDSVELITYACTPMKPSPVHHCSFRNVPRDTILNTISQPTANSNSAKLSNNDSQTTSSIIFVSRAKSNVSPALSFKQNISPNSSSIRNADVEKALIDFYQCTQIDEVGTYVNNHIYNSESEDLEYSLSNYNEICDETSSLLRLNEQISSAFTDDESNVEKLTGKIKSTQEHKSNQPNDFAINLQNDNNLMKMMVLNKSRTLPMDSSSDEQTRTNSFSLNTYSQDFSVDKIYQYESSTSSYKQYPRNHFHPSSSHNQPDSQPSWYSSSSTVSSSSTDKQLPSLLLCSANQQHLLATVEKKRNTSSDSDAITITTTTTLTGSTQNECIDLENNKQIIRDSITQDVLIAFNKLHGKNIDGEDINQKCEIIEKNSNQTNTNETDMKCDSLTDTATRDNETSMYGSHDDPSSSLNHRASSKVTFESIMTQNSLPSSPKMKDQAVMAQIEAKGLVNSLNTTQEFIQNVNETKNGRSAIGSEGTMTSGSTSGKSSVKELMVNQKSINHRKSKSQNRARKALRTITFILGAFVVCWTPWHIYSAIQSLCESCKKNWIFSNPMFHCFYFLCYLNSPINPFCYALANQQFKKTFTRILRLDLRRL